MFAYLFRKWCNKKKNHLSGRLSFFLSVYYLFLTALGLCCCVCAFSSWGEQGLLSNCSAQASHCGGFSCCKAWTLGCPKACGIFLEQELNPWPCTGRQILIHCTTREVLFLISLWELYFGTLSYILQVFFSLLFYLYIYIYKHIWLANDCFCYIQFFFSG